MRRYETIIIMDPELSEDGRKPIFERLDNLVGDFDGYLVDYDEWGGRRLAYEIKKKNRGYYVCMDYCGTGPLVNEIERFFRIDDRILKFMTILQQDAVDVEQIKAATDAWCKRLAALDDAILSRVLKRKLAAILPGGDHDHPHGQS